MKSKNKKQKMPQNDELPKDLIEIFEKYKTKEKIERIKRLFNNAIEAMR